MLLRVSSRKLSSLELLEYITSLSDQSQGPVVRIFFLFEFLYIFISSTLGFSRYLSQFRPKRFIINLYTMFVSSVP
ncbi:hypothetical protein IF1G_04469 [Cordyceps javanica]|uniref:Uncharacterized protein n=1 Tax=Cordyceps javanica TaxID=43265 RepID=A0A545V690_9HYPO|nr:hypothetical protein IF1G_04469 [Cordyceps javanica]